MMPHLVTAAICPCSHLPIRTNVAKVTVTSIAKYGDTCLAWRILSSAVHDPLLEADLSLGSWIITLSSKPSDYFDFSQSFWLVSGPRRVDRPHLLLCSWADSIEINLRWLSWSLLLSECRLHFIFYLQLRLSSNYTWKYQLPTCYAHLRVLLLSSL